MAFKPNYNQQRAERDRLKQAKRDAKLKERGAASKGRKTEDEAADAAADGAEQADVPAGETPDGA